jgi:hypothetical protein
LKSQLEILNETFNSAFKHISCDNSPAVAVQHAAASAGDDTPAFCTYQDGERCTCDECRWRCWREEYGCKDCECQECEHERAMDLKDRIAAAEFIYRS